MTRKDLEAMLGKPAWVVSKAGRDEGTDGKAMYFMQEKNVRQ